MGSDFDASWRVVGPRLVLLTSAGQLGAARNGASYVPMVLDETGVDVKPLAEVEPRALAGYASDGRSLDGLLYSAVTTAKTAMGEGASTAEALASGQEALELYVRTLLADSLRQAASVQIAARPTVGYVRQVNPPCCSRCAILAGRFYRWSAGFRRHPRCDCTNVPATQDTAEGLVPSAQSLFDGGHVRGLSEGQQKAIADGADPAQVVNAYRVHQLPDGTYMKSVHPNGLTTSEGATSRGRFGQLAPDRARLTPDGIYRLASTREEALRLLRSNGYLK